MSDNDFLFACGDRMEDPEKRQRLLGQIESLTDKTGPLRLMEICGTHTMAIARSGIRSLLPQNLSLVSGPGCPVCVTPSGIIDEILSLSEDPRILITSYGDLLRVPGSRRGDSLLRRRAMGAGVKDVYSPMDAIQLAQENPDKEVVFLGVGFETTAPGTAACILEASQQKISNFSVLCLLKQTMPALRALIESSDFSVNGFLCPGHVAAITGSEAFSFLPRTYGIPAVVAGFEPADLLSAIYMLVSMIAEKRPALQNEYLRLVRPEGNPLAIRMMNRVFISSDDTWRGLGFIPDSGFSIRPEFAQWDAARRFSLPQPKETEIPGCRCASVIRGVLPPSGCPLFGKTCTPADPVGPCMVSGEGACAAAYRYGTGGF